MRWIKLLPALATALLLQACATGLFEPQTKVEVHTVTITVCPNLDSYPPEMLSKAADAYDQLPPDSPLRTMLDDYRASRAEIRVCIQKKLDKPTGATAVPPKEEQGLADPPRSRGLPKHWNVEEVHEEPHDCLEDRKPGWRQRCA